jgi:hypothetical protein
LTVSHCKAAAGSSAKAAGPIARLGIDKKEKISAFARLCSFDASVDLTGER